MVKAMLMWWRRISGWYDSLEADSRYIVAAHGAVGRVMRHLLAGLSPDEVKKFVFPQDRVFVFSGGEEQII